MNKNHKRRFERNFTPFYLLSAHRNTNTPHLIFLCQVPSAQKKQIIHGNKYAAFDFASCPAFNSFAYRRIVYDIPDGEPIVACPKINFLFGFLAVKCICYFSIYFRLFRVWLVFLMNNCLTSFSSRYFRCLLIFSA